MAGVDEAALLSQIAGGQGEAPLRELYRRYEGRLYGFGRRLLGDNSLAEELVQETLLKVWRNADRYEPARGPVDAFVFTIANRIAIDLWRRPSSRPLPGTFEAEPTADHTDRVVDELALRGALGVLSPAHREVLRLSYEDGLKQVEIADRLGVPLNTVKTRTYHALRALRSALTEQGVSGG